MVPPILHLAHSGFMIAAMRRRRGFRTVRQHEGLRQEAHVRPADQ